METISGLQIGAELFAGVAVAFEIIIWKEVPSLLSVNLFQWGQRSFNHGDLQRSLTPLRVQFMWLDLEVYIVRGVDD